VVKNLRKLPFSRHHFGDSFPKIADRVVVTDDRSATRRSFKMSNDDHDDSIDAVGSSIVGTGDRAAGTGLVRKTRR